VILPSGLTFVIFANFWAQALVGSFLAVYKTLRTATLGNDRSHLHVSTQTVTFWKRKFSHMFTWRPTVGRGEEFRYPPESNILLKITFCPRNKCISTQEEEKRLKCRLYEQNYPYCPSSQIYGTDALKLFEIFLLLTPCAQVEMSEFTRFNGRTFSAYQSR
jgi:hypothetical protein